MITVNVVSVTSSEGFLVICAVGIELALLEVSTCRSMKQDVAVNAATTVDTLWALRQSQR